MASNTHPFTAAPALAPANPVLLVVGSDYALNNELETQLMREFGNVATIEKAEHFREALQLGYELQEEGRRIAAVVFFINGQDTTAASIFLHYLFTHSPAASCIVYSSNLELSMMMAEELSDCFPSIQSMALPWNYNNLNARVAGALERFMIGERKMLQPV
jgi:hypothetical protein